MKEMYSDFRTLTDGFSVRYAQHTAFKLKHGKGALVSYENKTYAAFAADIRHLATVITQNGWHKETIAVIGKNCYEWMVAYFAVLYAGGTVTPFDKALTETELARQCDTAKAKIAFCGEEYAGFFESCNIYTIPFKSKKWEDAVSSDNPPMDFSYADIDPNRASILLFTSGTTAAAKVVMLSQKNILENAYAMTIHEKFYADDVSAALLPFHHAFGMTQTVLFLSLGMCTVFCEGLRIARCMKEYGVSVLVIVPRIADEIKHAAINRMQSDGLLRKFNTAMKVSRFFRHMGIDLRRIFSKKLIDAMGGKLRLIIVGAAPSNPETLNWFNDLGILTVQGYGLTETAPTISAESHKFRRSGSVGKALPGLEIKIDNPGQDGIGEIAVRGKNVMLGYMNNEEANKAVFKNGYFLTGDMGYLDRDGYLFITGRKKNVIVLQNGKNVFPEEIEELINRADFVKECVVREKDGFICADIVYKPNFTKDAAELAAQPFIENLNTTLPSFKKIAFYNLTDKEFEKTSTLKIKR